MSPTRVKEVLYDSEAVLRLVDRELEELLEELGDGAPLGVVLERTRSASGVPESPAHERTNGRPGVQNSMKAGSHANGGAPERTVPCGTRRPS